MKLSIPQNPTAEHIVLGCLLLGAPHYAVPLREDHFAAPDHRLVFACILELAEGSQPVDVHSVTSRLTAKGQLEHAGGPVARFLSDGAAGGEAMLRHYFPDLETARQSREAFLYAEKFLPEVASFRMPASQFVEELAVRCAPMAKESGASAADIVAGIQKTWESGDDIEAFPTGVPALNDALLGGFHRGELAVVAADTGGGKSVLLTQIAAANARKGIGVVYLSLEMPREDVMLRFTSACSGQPNPQRRANQLTLKEHSEWEKADKAFKAALGDAKNFPLTIHDDVTDLASIAAAVRSAVRHQRASIAIVDYLQLVECVGDTREQAVSEIARKLKILAAQEHIAILTASQINESGQLRESRAIGHHANAVIHIFEEGDRREDGIKPCAMRLAKFRRGPTEKITGVGLDGATSRFVSLN
jgi:replicative DNA helicase